MKLQDFLNQWLTTAIMGSVQTSTYMIYNNYISNHINPVIGEKELDELKTEHIQNFVRRLADNDKKKLSPRTINFIFSMLRSVFEYAVEYGYIIKNPCLKIRLLKLKEKEIEIFNRAEQSKIEQTIIKSEDKRNIAIMVCLYTGLRIGELCALKWENINFDSGQLNIKQSMIRIKNLDISENFKTKLVLEEPKTVKSKRLIPIPDFLRLMLAEFKKESNSQYIFTLNWNKPIQPRTLQNIYKRLLEKAGVKYRNFHTLRHTFASRAIELGIDVKTVSEILGHSNTNITINRYTHSLMEQKEKMMIQFNNYYFKEK